MTQSDGVPHANHCPSSVPHPLCRQPTTISVSGSKSSEYGDLYAQGVIDPAKVVRTALQDAASVAGLLVTTEAMIAEKPKKDAAPALPAGAGMDF
jgi:chaperonin GroEL